MVGDRPNYTKHLTSALSRVRGLTSATNELIKGWKSKSAELKTGAFFEEVKRQLKPMRKITDEKLKKQSNAVLADGFAKSIYADYEKATGKCPYDFQKYVVATLVKQVTIDHKRCFIELPTGVGKSVIINLTAQVLHYMNDKKTYCVAPNKLLALWGKEHFALHDYGYDAYVEAAKSRHKVIHLSAEQMLEVSDAVIRDANVIIDESDACLQQQRGIFRASKTSTGFNFSYLVKKFALAHTLCGVSGTIPEHAEE